MTWIREVQDVTLCELIIKLEQIDDQIEGDPDVLIDIEGYTVRAEAVEYSPENAAFGEYVKIS